MKLFLIAFIFTLALSTTIGQYRYQSSIEKPGSCPPPVPVNICSMACFSDSHCLGIGKCCPTNCGGFTCTKPVTMRQPGLTEKPGSCPAQPKGRWVCSPTCTVDSDCRGTLKCCKNRCGALACQKPDSNQPSNIPANPYVDSRNPNYYPYYFYNN